jgi:hypothetical protein
MTTSQQADVTAGLKAVHSDAPIRSLYVQGTATWNQWDGAVGKLEVGTRLARNVSLFGAATLDSRGPGAELGVRWDWGW